MNKTKYIRTSSGSMMPVYPHVLAKKEPLQHKKISPQNISEVKKDTPIKY